MDEVTYDPGDILILIVDDNATNLQVLGRLLSDSGYRTGVARSGKKAIQFIEKQKVDLIIMDIMMPEMDGYETFEEIKKIDKNIPVIFLSALKGYENKVKAFEKGGVDYIEKPFHRDEVVARINTQLKLQITQKKLEVQNRRLKEEIALRKESEILLIDTKRKMQALFHNAEIGILFIDENFNIQYNNPAMQRIIGYSEQELYGINLNQFVDLKDRGKDQRYWDRLISGEIDYYEVEKSFRTKSADLIDAHTKTVAYRNDDNKIEYILVLIEDITQKNRIQEAFDSYLFFLQLLIETIPTPVYYKNLEGKYVGCNSAFSDIVGKSKSDIIGQSCLNLFPEETALKHKKREEELLKSRETSRFEAVIQNANGDELYVIYNKAVYFNDKNKVGGIIGTILDITQRKKTEERLKDSEKKLIDLNASKDKFFSIIAHDLKNPFNSLIGLSEIILQDYKELSLDQIINTVTSIHKSARSAYGLLQNLLEWARSQTSSLEFKPTDFSIRHLTEEAIFPLMATSEKKKITIDIDIDSKIGVYGDENMIKTVIRNLVSNALKFTHSGGNIFITSKAEEKFCTVQVRDTGIGIEKDKIPLLFRIDKHYTRRGTSGETGTSLGLILCKEFVEKNGGEIGVNSVEKKGTEFFFTVPLSEKSQTFKKKDSDERLSEKDLEKLNKRTILYADDDDDSYNLISLYLRKFDIKILRAEDGMAAVETVKENPQIDLVLLDYEMPLLNGQRAMEEIRKIRELPILIMTSHSEHGMISSLLKNGFNDYVSKPVIRNAFLKILSQNLA